MHALRSPPPAPPPTPTHLEINLGEYVEKMGPNKYVAILGTHVKKNPYKNEERENSRKHE